MTGADEPWGPATMARAVAWVKDRRAADGLAGHYDVIASDATPADDPAAARAAVAAWREAGATWWIEADWETTTVGPLRRRIEAGPPR
jgi:hypothetical protein